MKMYVFSTYAVFNWMTGFSLLEETFYIVWGSGIFSASHTDVLPEILIVMHGVVPIFVGLLSWIL